MTRNFRRQMLGLAVLGAGLGGAGGAASAEDMTALYSQYHQAIAASMLCRDVSLDQAAWGRVSTYIDAKVNYEIRTGERLSLIEAAKSDARELVEDKGCESEDVGVLLALYEAELANLP
jgi:hypothetical protein